MSTKAHVKIDWQRGGIALVAVRDLAPGVREVAQWQPVHVKRVDPDGPLRVEDDDADWLRLDEDYARAIYEALAEHFGHSGHDTRALRRDYDAERGRVDKLITHLTAEASR